MLKLRPVFMAICLIAASGAAAVTVVDPTALVHSPEAFAGKTIYVPGQILGKPTDFREKSGLDDYLGVSLRTAYGDFSSSPAEGAVLIGVRRGSPAEHTIAAALAADAQHRPLVMARITVTPQHLVQAYVHQVQFYLGAVEDVVPGRYILWSELARHWREFLGKRVATVLSIAEPLQESRQRLPGFRLLKGIPRRGSSTRSYFGTASSLMLAVPDSEAGRAPVAAHMAKDAPFGLATVLIREQALDSGSSDGKTLGLAIVEQFKPFVTVPETAETGWHPRVVTRLCPLAGDVRDFFKEAEEKLKRGQYDDNVKDASGKLRYRTEGNAPWKYSEAATELAAGQRVVEAWLLGERTYRRSNTFSSVAGNTVYVTDYGTSTHHVKTWQRLAYNPQSKAYEIPDLAATRAHLKALQEQITELRPRREAFIQAVQKVEERAEHKSLQRSVEMAARQLERVRAQQPRTEYLAGRVADAEKRLEQAKQRYADLAATYKAAKTQLVPLDRQFKALVAEAMAYATAQSPPLGYQW